MPLLPLITFSFLLGLLPFSVALSSSIYRCIVWKEALKIALVFAISQAAMMLVGWLIGFAVRGMLYSMAVPVASFIIFLIGARMFLDSRRMGFEHRTISVEDQRMLLGFALVISINTLLLGMGIGIIYREILALTGLLFVGVFILTIAGIQAGKRGMVNLGRSAELLASVSLVIISVVIVLQYLKII